MLMFIIGPTVVRCLIALPIHGLHIFTQQPSTWSCAREIVRIDGLGKNGLFKGLTATLGRNGVWNGVYFGTYYNLKSLLLDPTVRRMLKLY